MTEAANACCAVGKRLVMAVQKARFRLRSPGFRTTTAVGMGARKVDGPASCVAKTEFAFGSRADSALSGSWPGTAQPASMAAQASPIQLRRFIPSPSIVANNDPNWQQGKRACSPTCTNPFCRWTFRAHDPHLRARIDHGHVIPRARSLAARGSAASRRLTISRRPPSQSWDEVCANSRAGNTGRRVVGHGP